MPNDEYVKSEYKEVILYLFIGTFFALVLPALSGLIKRGFAESFVAGEPLRFGSYLGNFTIYIPLLLIALMCIIYPIAKTLSLKRGQHPAIHQPVGWFRMFTVSYIYSPEENGMLWKLSESVGLKGNKNFMRWSLNPLRVFIVAILVFGAYGLVLVNQPQIAVSGVPQLQLQQFSVQSEVAFNSFVPAFAENGLLLFVFMFLMGIVAFIVAKNKWGIWAFFALGILICLLMGFMWGGLHSITYGNDDAKFWATVFFGFVGSLITLLTGIFIFWFVWHIMNNMFITLSQVISFKEDILLIGWIIWAFVLVAWLLIEYRGYVQRKKKRLKGEGVSIPGG